MIIADDDDDVLEREDQQTRAAADAAALPADEPEVELDGTADEDHFKILPLVLQMLQAHAGASGDGGRLAVHMAAIHQRLRRCEAFIAEHELSVADDDPDNEQRSMELLARRTELLRDHKRRRLPAQSEAKGGESTL